MKKPLLKDKKLYQKKDLYYQKIKKLLLKKENLYLTNGFLYSTKI